MTIREVGICWRTAGCLLCACLLALVAAAAATGAWMVPARARLGLSGLPVPPAAEARQ